MSYIYADRKRTDTAAAKNDTAPGQPSLDTLRTGAAKPTQEQMGRRVVLELHFSFIESSLIDF